MLRSSRYTGRSFGLALLLLVSLIFGCGRDGGYQSPGNIGPAGGTITATSGPESGASVTVPAGALSAPVTLTLSQGADIAEPDYLLAGPAVEFAPTSTQLSSAVTIQVPYDPAQIPSGFAEADLIVLWEGAAGQVTVLIPTSVDTTNNLVTVEASALGTFQAAILNQAPSAQDQAVSTAEDSALPITLIATDPEGKVLTCTVVTQPANGTLSGTAPNLTYTPNADFNGSDAFTFQANDGMYDSNVATVSIAVSPVNDAPLATDDSAATDQDTAVTVNVLANDSDADGDALTITAITQPSSGTVVDNGDGTVTYMPNLGFVGTDTFDYTIGDGNGDAATATVSVSVTLPPNAPPVAIDDTVIAYANFPEDIDVLANDTDLDGDPLAVTSVSQGTYGAVTVNADGTVRYFPMLGFIGQDSFAYEISDGAGNTATATVSVGVGLFTERVSIGIDGTPTTRNSGNPAISGDGRYVSFHSSARNLVADGENRGGILLYDRQTALISRVSVAVDGTAAGCFYSPYSSRQVSGDGQYIVYQCGVSNLVAGDTNGAQDIFVYDQQAGLTTRVSVATDGTEANARSQNPSISSDGRFVAFVSEASNLVANDTNGVADAFLHDRQTGETTLMGGNGKRNMRTAVSSDGRYAAFGYSGIYFHERLTGQTNFLTGGSHPSMSSDGRYVASYGSNVFVHDRQTSTTVKVSVATDGSDANDSSNANTSISGDGRFVVFASRATNLWAGSNFGTQVFIHDRDTDEDGIYDEPGAIATTQVSVGIGGIDADGLSASCVISTDGRFIAFDSRATNLVSADGVASSSISEDVYVAANPFLMWLGPGEPARLLFETAPQPSETAGQVWAPFTVKIVDRFGDVVTAATNPVRIWLTSGTDTLNGTLLRTPVNGVVRFDDLSYKTAEQIALNARAPGLTGIGKRPMVISPAPPAQLVIAEQPQDTAVGVVIAPALLVEVLDAYGNLMPTSTDSVTIAFGSNPGGGLLSGTTTAIPFNGVATFADLTIDAAGNGYTLVASAAGLSEATSNPFYVAGAATQLAFGVNPSLNEQQNVIFSFFGVEVQDALGLVVPTDNTTQVTLMLNTGTGTLGGTLTKIVTGGVAVYDDVTYDTAEVIALGMSSVPPLTPNVSGPIDVAAPLVPSLPIYRASVDSLGNEVVGQNTIGSISADGRYIAFLSSASTLVANDTNAQNDSFVHDRLTGETTRVSVDSSGAEADLDSLSPDISASGRHVAFRSYATNLVANDTNTAADIFVHDRQTGQTDRVSLSASGTEGDLGSSVLPSISANGRYVAFQSSARNLVADDTNYRDDIFVHDRWTGQIVRVSVDSAGAETDGSNYAPSISADERFVAFSSRASNLVPNDMNLALDIFVHDRQTGTTERVSVATDGTEGDRSSTAASISSNGRHVAFESEAGNLVLNDVNGEVDIFVHDRQTGTTVRVSVATDGTEANWRSHNPSISADGRFVAFRSLASNLVIGDANVTADIFVHDRDADGDGIYDEPGAIATVRVSVDAGGVEANSGSDDAIISADGRYVGFSSYASNLVPGDTNGVPDIFIAPNPLAP